MTFEEFKSLVTTSKTLRKNCIRKEIYNGAKANSVTVDQVKRAELLGSRRNEIVPAIDFPLFSLLPPELRSAIWRAVALHSRIIELEHVPIDPYDINNDFPNEHHQFHQATMRSCIIPPILLVNKESRNETISSYPLPTFDYLAPGSTLHRHVRFNAAVDILYLGEHTCVINMLNTFDITDEAIPHVAIVASSQGKLCSGKGITQLGALHGVEAAFSSWPSRRGGCVGLKKISIVVKSKLYKKKLEDANTYIGFRPATSDGLTKGHIRIKQSAEADITLVENGQGLNNVGRNVWIGEAIPKFRFVSLAPIAKGGEQIVFDRISTDEHSPRKLGYHQTFTAGFMSNFVRGVQREHGVEIEVIEREWIHEDPREISVSGNGEAVDRAIAVLKRVIAS